LLLCATTVLADENKSGTAMGSALPTGEEVLDRYLEVTGGKEAHAKVKNRVVEGTLEFVGMGIKSKLTAFNAEPNKVYIAMETEGLGLIEEGCDGDIVWSNSLMQGPQILKGDVRASKLRTYRMNRELHWRELFERVECVGLETAEGQLCYKVKRTPTIGTPEKAFYAKDTGLLVRLDVIAETPMGSVPVKTVAEDYRKVGDVMYPFRETIRSMGREQRIEYDDIGVNMKLSDEQFDPPDDVKALAKKQKEK